MIREAIAADIPEIVALGRKFLLEGPYKNELSDNPEQNAVLTLEVIKEKGKVLVLEEDSAVRGVLGFILFPHYFSGELTAGELIWYVEPEYRKGCPALKLLWAAEALAKKLGAKRMQFTAPTSDISRIYERFGYKQVEVSFQKAL